MDVRILGPLEVWEGSEQLVIDSPRQRAILALLAIHVNEVVSADRIADELWGDDPPGSPVQTLRYHVSKLRSSLGEAAKHVVTRSPGYVLEVDSDNIDTSRFETMAAEGRGLIAAEADRAARVLVDALGMWRGAPLADFTYESFARSEILRLEELRLAVLEDRIDADLASGRQSDLVGELKALVAVHPLRERMWGQLMIALYRSGRQAEALRACQQARDALGEIGIEPSGELCAIEEQILMHDPLLQMVSRRVRRSNLPERLSSFIGRIDEAAGIAELLGKHRLVTLTGIGGVGKTSMAVEAARPLVDDFADGVWFVPVADVGDPKLIPERAAQILGVQIRSAAGLVGQLGEYLNERRTLVIFDGCERHVDAVAELVESLLVAAPELTVMVTSREPLDVGGECRFEVPVLDAGGAESDAVRLFVDRAGLVQPGFEVTPDNVEVVTRVCRSVAGIPLAVELAAARLGAVSLPQIDERLDDQMALLVHSRRDEAPHGSLRAVVDWSHELLESTEQIVFRRLAVFRGGATVEAAERVCADETLPADGVLNLLARLVDVSLVVADREHGRFEMLDPVRQYAERQLGAAGEAPLIKGRHAVYYRDLALEAFDGMIGPEEDKWSRVCAQEEPNHIAAITWALDSGEPAVAVETAAYLANFWNVAGRKATTGRFLAVLLEEARKRPSRELVLLLAYAAAFEPGGRAVSLAEEALEVAREVNDQLAIGWALKYVGTVVGWTQDFARGVDVTRQAFEYLDRTGHPQAASCLFNLAGMLVRIDDKTGGRLDEAEAAARELLARATDLQSRHFQVGAYEALGWVALYRGDLDVARRQQIAAMELQADAPADRTISWIAHILIGIELAAGNIDRAIAYHERFGSLISELWGGVYLPMDGALHIATGDTEAGIKTLLDALDTYAGSNDIETVYTLIALAGASIDTEDAVIASRLYSAAETIRKRRNLALTPHQTREMQENLAKLSTTLGDERYAEESAKGEAMTTEEIVAYAHSALQPKVST